MKEQLGMNPSTASNRLVKDLLYDFVVKSGKDICFRCGENISRETLSIEHKTAWLDSESPLENFFALDNIAYSHLKCNILAGRKPPKTAVCGSTTMYSKGCRCELCKAAKAALKKRIYTPEKRRMQYARSGN